VVYFRVKWLTGLFRSDRRATRSRVFCRMCGFRAPCPNRWGVRPRDMRAQSRYAVLVEEGAGRDKRMITRGIGPALQANASGPLE
jgi:hypothetical protein